MTVPADLAMGAPGADDEHHGPATPSPRPVTVIVLGALGLLVVVLGLIGPWLTTGSTTATVGVPFSGDGGWLGTDQVGRDVWVRLLHGGRPVVLVAVAATAVATVLGSGIGLVVGLLPQRVSMAVTWWTDLPVVVPAVLLLLVLGAGFPGSDLTVLVAVVITTVPYSVRIVGAATRALATQGFVELAMARGDRFTSVVRRDVLPNVAGPLVADAGLRFVAAIYLTATAGFLGLGSGGTRPSWGRMINEAAPGVSLNAWALLAPLLCVLALSVSANLVADHAAARVGQGRR